MTMGALPAERFGDAPPAGCPTRIIQVIAQLLTDMVRKNDLLPVSPSQITPFHSSKPPAISVSNYLVDRILKYAGVSEETIILALIYIDLVVQYNPEFVITSLNIHRLLITSVMLASKYFDDLYYNNAYYARVGGISNAEVNNLEMEMLRMISFSLFVPADQFERYRRSLYDQLHWTKAAAVAASVPMPIAVSPTVASPSAVDSPEMMVDHSHAQHYHANALPSFHPALVHS